MSINQIAKPKFILFTCTTTTTTTSTTITTLLLASRALELVLKYDNQSKRRPDAALAFW